MESQYLRNILAHASTQQIEWINAIFALLMIHGVKINVNSWGSPWSGWVDNKPAFSMQLLWYCYDEQAELSQWHPNRIDIDETDFPKAEGPYASVDYFIACLAHEIGHLMCLTNDQLNELNRSRMSYWDLNYTKSTLMFELEIEAWQWARKFLNPIWSPHMQDSLLACLNSYAKEAGLVIDRLENFMENSVEQNI